MVGLVQDRDLDAAERARAPVEQVDQPARGRHDDVHAVPQRGDLAAVRHAAVDRRDGHADAAAERREHVRDLLRQLTRGHQHQAAGRALGTGRAGQPGQHRQAERERLARAGLCPAEHVPPGHRVRERPRLDRERLRYVPRRERADQPLGQAELAERRRRGRGLGGGLGQGAVEPGVRVGLRGTHRPGRPSAPARRAATAPPGGAAGRLTPAACGLAATAARLLLPTGAVGAGRRVPPPCIVRHA